MSARRLQYCLELWFEALYVIEYILACLSCSLVVGIGVVNAMHSKSYIRTNVSLQDWDSSGLSNECTNTSTSASLEDIHKSLHPLVLER
jgi:hypothetical protein